jgi:His-Xaa-Ser system protein HxsD
MTALRGFPETYTLRDDGGVDVLCHARVYPAQAVFSATYALLDRGYVRLDRDEDGNHIVQLYPREGEVLRDLVGSLANELLASVCRAHLHQRKEVLLESVTLAAMSGAVGRPSLDDLEGFDFTDAGLDDPLSIASSWDAKYERSKTPAAEPEPEPEPVEESP